jgi:hypothetical protein
MVANLEARAGDDKGLGVNQQGPLSFASSCSTMVNKAGRPEKMMTPNFILTHGIVSSAPLT